MVSVNADARRAVPVEEREPIVLVDRESSYRDGAEQVLVDLISAATDISSTSDEMLANAVDWPQVYHVDPARANVLRALDLPSDAVVLEVGSGCGAITRYLGETVAHVDSIEPVADRARVGRLRTRDLPNVDVYVGQVQDLPDEERYDLVVVVGVLEYVGAGSADPEPYRDFLAACRSRLKPGGSLILAIENKFGVKYLAGAPEDHYGVPYVGVDGYPRGELARTFSRHELLELVSDSDFTARPLIAFPDYKLTRVVLDPDRLESGPERELLAAVPTFPSPDWVGERADGADERRLWAGLVEARLAGETGNSLLVLAHTGDEPAHDLWPSDRAGRYFSRGRRPLFTSVATILTGAEGVVVRRSPLMPDAAIPGTDAVFASEVAFVAGEDLVDRLAAAEEDEARGLLDEWRRLADAAAADAALSFDFVPHNLRVTTDGALAFIDDEWLANLADASGVLRRGVVLTAVHLQRVGVAGDWGVGVSGRELAARMGRWVGLGDDDWISAAIEREAELQVRVGQRGPSTTPDRLRSVRAAIESVLASTVGASLGGAPGADRAPEVSGAVAPTPMDPTLQRRLELGEAALVALTATEKRTADRLDAIRIENEEHTRAVLADAERQIVSLELVVQNLTARLEASERGVREVHASTSWKVTAPLRGAAKLRRRDQR